MTRAVLLDLMNTVLPDPFFDVAPALAGSMKRFFAVKNAQAHIEFELGNLDEAGYFEVFFKDERAERAAGFSPVQFKEKLLQRPIVGAGVGDLVADLRKQYQVHIASNYSCWIDQLLAQVPIEFDRIFASHELRVRKPSPEFFEAILDDLGLVVDEVVFVDDQPVNLEAARAMGIKSYDANENWVSQVRQDLL